MTGKRNRTNGSVRVRQEDILASIMGLCDAGIGGAVMEYPLTHKFTFRSGNQDYDAEVTYNSDKEMLDGAITHLKWKLQRLARENKVKPGKTIQVGWDGQVYKSFEDQIDEMGEEQREALLQALLKKKDRPDHVLRKAENK